MDRLLCPNTLELDPDSSNAATHWNHWQHRFQNFVRSTSANEEQKLRLLINYISPSIYEYVSQCNTYNEAVSVLRNIFVKPVNEVFARHKLFTRRQQPNESIDRYLESLRLLSRDCQFKAVTAETNRDDCIRDSFIRGLLNPVIRQRLLENETLTLIDTHRQARSLELAQLHSLHEAPSPAINAVDCLPTDSQATNKVTSSQHDPEVGAIRAKCYFCGGTRHPRANCPAKDKLCDSCGKTGHFQKVCRSQPRKHTATVQDYASVISCPVSHQSKVKATVTVNGYQLCGMLDSGSDISLIDEKIAHQLKLKILKANDQVGLASNIHKVTIKGTCKANLEMLGHKYPYTKLSVMPNLCSEVIIGRDLLQLHSSVHFEFGGGKSPLLVCAFTAANVKPANLFTNLSPNCKPVAVKSVRHSLNDSQFIEAEINKLLNDGVIEKSNSPWRAQ